MSEGGGVRTHERVGLSMIYKVERSRSHRAMITPRTAGAPYDMVPFAPVPRGAVPCAPVPCEAVPCEAVPGSPD